MANARIPIMLVADDQILPEACLLRLQAGADIASQWALATGQQYHVPTPEKTAVVLFGDTKQLDAYSQAPLILSGAAVPGTLLKKWVGIIWDNNLSFEPFLQDRIRAARASFAPSCALARDGLVALSEIRSAMLAKVDNTLFYGSMFLFLVPDAASKLTDLQTEFERSLLGAPPWMSWSHIRAAGGWLMSWGDRLQYDALAFRAELWCCENTMLVRSVWEAGQTFPDTLLLMCRSSL